MGWAVGVCALVGLALRVAMGSGGLWLDEAWSVVMAHDAGGPLAVLTGIHHDNNHPLNSWWLQLVGPSAPPLLMRSLAMVSSTLTILVAARFATRRSELSGVFAALLFAIAPILVLLGSEARGYAPMLLALMWTIDRLDPLRPNRDRLSTTPILAASMLGTLGHILMFPSLLLIACWLFLASSGRGLERLKFVAERLGPALIASFLTIAFIVGMAVKVQGGMTIGNSTPFSWAGLASGLGDAAHFTLGLEAWGLLLVPLLLVCRPRAAKADYQLWLCLGLGLAVAAALFHASNSHIARYFLPSSLALLLLVAIRCGTIVRHQYLAFLALIAVAGASLLFDSALISGKRGEPDRPFAIIATERPAGARLLLGSERLSALVQVSNSQTHGKVRSVGPSCGAADYLLADLEQDQPTVPLTHCGRAWTLIDYRPPPYRGGVGWALYR